MSDIELRDADQVDLFSEENWGKTGYAIAGADFDVDKEWLIGVPHVITSVTFWVPTMNNGYVSCEATVAPQAILDRAVKRNKVAVLGPDNRPMVEAGEKIGYNDGGTGIRRQIVQLLEKFELIKIKSKLGETGEMGQSRYDLDYSHWEFDVANTTKQGEDIVPHFTRMHNGAPFSLTVMGGLQSSMGGKHRPKDAKPTYYLS